MVELHNARYEMELGCGMDAWRLKGEVYGHPDFEDGKIIFTSTPIEFDEKTNFLKTASGREYFVFSYGSKRESIVEQIKRDIEKGGYEVH